jgi:hypothetical protein
MGLFNSRGPEAPPQPTPEELDRNKLEEDKREILGVDRSIQQRAARRSANSLLLSTGLGIPGVNTNRGR